jgi:hypothetical protein
MHRTDDERLYREMGGAQTEDPVDLDDFSFLQNVATIVLYEYSVDKLNISRYDSFRTSGSMLAADKTLSDAVRDAYKNRTFEDLGRQRKFSLRVCAVISSLTSV